jgi:mono/diheme cytochrome c family protein
MSNRAGTARRTVVRRSLSVIAIFATFASVAMIATFGRVWADAPAASGSTDYSKIPPADLVKQTPKGKIKNPYKDTQADIVSQGEGLFRSYSCSGCHGGNGGGGMCPPLTNDTWVYGGDDDTLFRLVTLGSDELQKAGYSRTGHENVVGPMPPFGSIVKTSDDLFKIIAFIRSHYDGDPSAKYGDQPQ